MNRFASTLYRDVTCAAAAALITFVLSLSFVASTSSPPPCAARAAAAMQAGAPDGGLISTKTIKERHEHIRFRLLP